MTNILKKIFNLGGKKEIDKSHISHKKESEENLNEFEKKIAEENYDEWLNGDYEEGQLSIDVYQTPKDLVIKSTIAGVKPDDIDISINNDMLTIRGKREMGEVIDSADYLYRECYWGAFSRSVILPCEVKAEKIDAYLEDGVLTIILPKVKRKKDMKIKVKEVS
jgi:HSP20 family protein